MRASPAHKALKKPNVTIDVISPMGLACRFAGRQVNNELGEQPCPLQLPETIRNPIVALIRVVADDRHQEGHIARDQMRTVHRQFPLESEIAFAACVSVLRNHRDEEMTFFDLLADGRIPGIPAAQLRLVEPHLDPDARSAAQIRAAASASPEA